MRWRARDSALAAFIFAGLAVVAAAVAIGFAAGHYGERVTTVTVAGSTPAVPAPSPVQVSPDVAAGAHTFVQFACSQCHGERGRGGVDPAVPALTTVGKALTIAQLTHIIDHGLGESKNPKTPYMPVWGQVISSTQVHDLVSYIRAGLPAVADTQPVPVPQGQGLAVQGAALYVKYGCINCHGPNGLGGVASRCRPTSRSRRCRAAASTTTSRPTRRSPRSSGAAASSAAPRS